MNSQTLPTHASVIVIGGGIMGCSTLYHLAKSGVGDALLLERNQLTSGTTWHSAAQVRALRSSRNLTNLIKYSAKLYASLEAETGQATGWINKGSVSIATNQDRLTHIRRQESLARCFDVPVKFISPGEAKERWPLMNAEDVIGAVWSPDDGRVNPSDLCAALVKGARSKGAQVFEETPVTGIVTQAGRVVGVETSRGEIRCEAIALCTGLWSREAARMAGVNAPLLPCEHFYLLTKPIPGAENHLPSLSDHDGHLYIRDESQGLLVGCFEPHGKPLDPAALGDDFAFQVLGEDWDHFEPMMRNALHRLPVLETAEVRTLLNGPESFTPDGSFMLGETAETEGLFLGCGLNSVGIASGGGAGMALAHNIVHGHMPADLGETDARRFPACFDSIEALMARAPEVHGRHYEITYPGRQWQSARNLRLTPLHQQWQEADAHFGQVYGWERPQFFDCSGEPTLSFGRPEWFEQVGREVATAHQEAAIFDQSTFGKIQVRGADAEAFLDRLCSNDMRRAPGRGIYTAMLNERGGYESDFTALRLGAEEYLLYVGTAHVRRDLAWLHRHLNAGERVEIEDVTQSYAILGLMGPNAAGIAAQLGAEALNTLGYFRHTEDTIAGINVRAVRLSYVGEAGWELTCASTDAPALYKALTGAGARPAGVLAQTSMRIEKRFLSMGHDLDADVTPVEAGLEFTVKTRGGFIGAEAVSACRESGPAQRMASIILDDAEACPLGDEPVYADETIVGQVTSAAYGYRVGKPVALAYVDSGYLSSSSHKPVELDIAGTRMSGIAGTDPAYDPQGLRMR